MAEILSRHRPIFLLATLVLAQVLLLAFQIKRDHDVRLIRYWAAEIVMPGDRGATWTFSKISGVWTGYIGLRSARTDNEALRARVGQLELRNRELETQAKEAVRLAALLDFREAHPEAPMLAAQVIGASADPSSETIFINRGDRDHVRRNQPVITPDGIVGKIVEVLPATSQVLLINDKDSGVGALFGDSRTHGIVKGTGDPQPRMDYVVNDEHVQPGEVILTSGEDRIFPKGLLIGTVTNAKDGYPFQTIQIKTAARLDRLEDVLVLLTRQELTPNKHDESADSENGQPTDQGVVQPEPKAAPPAAPTSAKASPTAQPPAAAPASKASSGTPAPQPAPPQE